MMMMMMKRGEGTEKRKEAKFLIALDVQSRFSESNESPTNTGEKKKKKPEKLARVRGFGKELTLLLNQHRKNYKHSQDQERTRCCDAKKYS